MATLVLSSIGTALGGPIGGALGSLVGQSIDQQLFGPGIRAGPRLGDLSVQASSYGTLIPRLYGTMRVAGTVVWATDLREEEAIQGGAKGAPEQIGYRYTVSLAVALSSRPIRAVRRIWADGKLLRGEAGDFKVRTGFRVHSGDEDQPIDPLIASVGTIDRTMAFRGLALALFEDLELAEFGNRIPMMTFEVEADEGAVGLIGLLRDASGGVIEASREQVLTGYAAYGRSVADSVAPLIDVCGVELTDRDGRLVGPDAGEIIGLEGSELGCGVDGDRQGAVERRRMPASAGPSAMAMTYYDPLRDYQAGQACASGGITNGRDMRAELPAAMPASVAKSLAEGALSRNIRSGEGVVIRLPPTRLGIGPGDRFRLPRGRSSWTVRTVTVEGLVSIVEAELTPGQTLDLTADGGRAVTESDRPIGRSELAVFELPSLEGAPASAIRVGLAVSNSGAWKVVPVELAIDGQTLSAQAVTRRAVLGRAESKLLPGSALLLEMESAVEIQLINHEQLLHHADEDALMVGANLALVGNELIQFGRAEEIGPGRYRLAQLLRGRRGTEWAMGVHAVGEIFCLLDGSAIRSIEVAPGAVGASLSAVAHGIADQAPLPEARHQLSGEAMRPLSPCHLSVRSEADGLRIEWTGRSHDGFAWIDGTAEVRADQTYRVTIDGQQGRAMIETSEHLLSIPNTQLSQGTGSVLAVSVATIGALGVSREARTTIIL